jgi:hypothetical protein
MSFYGKWETWKIVYYLPSDQWTGGNIKGVAFVEAGDRSHAMQVFREQYSGQFSTVDTVTLLG